jgi:oligosaccharyltransferase complex subunit delta (ribophorin II)
MFREPERRPPAFVSNLFTGLCMVPVLLLLILWARLGVNISNFPLSLSAITFHLGLGGKYLPYISEYNKNLYFIKYISYYINTL